MRRLIEAVNEAFGNYPKPGSFEYDATIGTISFVKEGMDSGITDIEELSDLAHKGWSSAVYDWKNKDLERRQHRERLAEISYYDLTEEDKEKDRVAVRAMLGVCDGSGKGKYFNKIQKEFSSIILKATGDKV